jgi:hypothetical protein
MHFKFYNKIYAMDRMDKWITNKNMLNMEEQLKEK